MNTLRTFAVVLVAGVALTTAVAADPILINGDPIPVDVTPQINPSPEVVGAINDAVNPTIHPSDAVTDAINDAVLGNKPGVAGGGIQRGADVLGGASLKCIVMGTPSEFPDDLRIRNAGLSSLPAGADIKWRVKAAGESGFVTLPRTLAPGETLRLNGVLEGGVEAGTACTAKLL
jgi:hypothetical protein